jgi:hypothetical protein
MFKPNEVILCYLAVLRAEKNEITLQPSVRKHKRNISIHMGRSNSPEKAYFVRSSRARGTAILPSHVCIPLAYARLIANCPMQDE